MSIIRPIIRYEPYSKDKDTILKVINNIGYIETLGDDRGGWTSSFEDHVLKNFAKDQDIIIALVRRIESLEGYNLFNALVSCPSTPDTDEGIV